MRQTNISLILFFIFLICVSCSSEFDRNKFGQAEHIAQDIQRSITAGAEYQGFSQLVNQLSSELSGLKTKAKSEKEKELLRDYSDLLDMYKDGLLLLKYKMEFSRYSFVPKGLIYVGQDIEPIVEKYKLETKDHIFQPTLQAWKSIPGDSINAVWFNAGIQFRRIINFLKE